MGISSPRTYYNGESNGKENGRNGNWAYREDLRYYRVSQNYRYLLILACHPPAPRYGYLHIPHSHISALDTLLRLQLLDRDELCLQLQKVIDLVGCIKISREGSC